MKALNLPVFEFRIRQVGEKKMIFDPLRRKYVVLTSEEWVRQNFLMYLITEKSYPASLTAVEAGLKVGKLAKRADIVIYNRQGSPLAIVECKAPEVVVNENVLDQAIRYNLAMNVKYIMLTNGLSHHCCSMNYHDKTFQFMDHIPDYDELVSG